MPYKCLIIDDNYKKGQQLKLLLETQPFVQEVLNTVHPYQINAYLLKEGIDIVFIRISLWEHRLFAAVYALRKKPYVVFLTSSNEKYWADERNRPIDMLHVPFEGKDVHTVFSGIRNNHVTAFDWNVLFVKHERRYHMIAFTDVLLVENKPNSSYVMLHTTKGKYLVKETVETMLDKLPMEDFVRISDELVIPTSNRELVHNDSYFFEGNIIPLTYRYMKQRERLDEVEME